MGDYSLVINNGIGGTITFDNSTNATRLKTRSYDANVNHSAVLSIVLENKRGSGTDNLLNSSCDLWSSGAAALDLGMSVAYSVDPTDFTTGLPGALTQYFRGHITSITQEENGDLTVVARGYLHIYDSLYAPKVSYTTYRDRASYDVGIISSGTYAYKLAIEGVDATGYYPGVDIAILTNDHFLDYGLDIDAGGTGAVGALTAGYAWAQAFVAENVEILGVLFQGNYTEDVSATEHSVMRISIRDDDGADRPSTTSLFYVDVTLTATGAQRIWTYFDTTNYTFERLIPGRKYWIHIEHYTTDATYPGYWQAYGDADGQYLNNQTDPHFVYGSVPLDSGSSEDTGNLCAFPYLAEVVSLPSTSYTYYLDGATPKLAILSLPSAYPGLDSPPTVLPSVPTSNDRGRCSYYYGTRELRYVMGDILDMDPDKAAGGAYSVDANITLGIPVYKIGGRPLGQCIRELCDLYGYNNSGTYYQSAILEGETPSPGFLVGRRKRTSESAVVTFAHGADTATDAQRRITSCSLRKQSLSIPSVIRVVGRSLDGAPIICERDGRGVGVGNWIDDVGHRVTEIINDASLTTLDAVNRRAWAELDKYARDTWEGEITVSGVYPHLISRSSGTYGSGEIIAVTHSGYGLSAEKFAVTGITVLPNRTVIRLSNADVLQKNIITDMAARGLRADAFLSDQDDMTYLYIYIYKLDTTADTTLFMQLCQSDDTILDSHSNYAAHRVACTRLTQPSGGTDYSTVVYRAEFAPENGCGTVERIEMYSDLTDGTEEAEFDFSANWDSSAEFYKSKRMRVVVEYGV